MEEYNTFITNGNINYLDELSDTLSSELPIEITNDNKNEENSQNGVNNLVNVINFCLKLTIIKLPVAQI